MRYAILSDVHANLEALTAVLDALSTEHIDGYLCLGDVVGYGADPAACLARLTAVGATMIAGNHDLACIGKLDLEWFNEVARAAILWTRDQLSVADLDQLRRLPLTMAVEPFTLVHGTLSHPARFEYLIHLAQAIDTLTICQTLCCLVGHTHTPCGLEYDRHHRRVTRVVTREAELAQMTFHNDPTAFRYLLNPGSVGQPRDGDARASCAVIDTVRTDISVRRIPYDVATAQRKIRAAGLPAFLADRLALGR